YPEGSEVRGRITNITDFGLFVEVEEGIEGLVHLSELSPKKIKTPGEMFEVGQEVQAKVIRVSADERRLGLSIKQFLEEQERSNAQKTRQEAQSASSNLGDLIRQKLENEE
ncbi:MAG: S1 RNA-binding domain-containing protein, partial [Desulfohalobiaceae bacterium]